MMDTDEFEERFNDEDVNVETCHGDSEVEKHFPGVSKTKTSWRARVRHPKLKVDVYLGSFETPTAAALAVNKKKAEFERLFKSESCMNVETCMKDSNARQKEDVKLDSCRGGSEVVKRFPGVSKSGRKWLARVRHPTMKIDVSCGRYESPEEAALAVKKKKAEFEEFYKCEAYVDEFDGKQQEDVQDETYDGLSEVRKLFLGVSKAGNKWQARARHPTLKANVYLGCYETPEAAALVVKKKEAEFEEMFKNENRVNEETCKVDFRGRESVYKNECGRWGARIWHPKLKYNASLGSYTTREAALVAVTNKSAELWKTYGWRAMVKPDRKDNGQFSEEPERENESISEISDELADDLKVLAGVCELKPGKWDARIIDPVSGDETWLGTFDTSKEAVRSLNKCKADFSAKRKRAEFDGSEFWPRRMPGNERAEFDGSEFWPKATAGNERAEFDGYDFGPNASPVNERAELGTSEVWPKAMPDNERVEFDGSEFCPKAVPGNEGNEGPPVTLECESDGCLTSVLGADNLNAITVDDQSNHEVATPSNERAEFDGSEFGLKATPTNETSAGCPVKLECEFDDGCLASVLGANNMHTDAVNDQSNHEVATPGNERTEFDGSEFVPKAKPGNEASEGCPMKLEGESDDGCLTSVSGADILNTVVVDNQSNHVVATPTNEMAEFDEAGFGPTATPDNDASEGPPVKLECEFDDGSLTAVLGADNLNTISVDDQSNHEVATPTYEMAEFDESGFGPKATLGNEASEGYPVKLECAFDDGCLTPVPSADNLNTVAVDDQSNHEVAIVKSENSSSAIVNEYGQLLGGYSELDEQMGFSLPDDGTDI